jgi:gamma-glutamyltranspeptidase/glutathione hydrolase
MRAWAVVVLFACIGCGDSTQPARVEDAAPASELRSERVPDSWRHPLDAPATVAEHGMVVSDAPGASRVGVAVLRGGGSAVDAALATAFALAVVLPSAGNLAGGGFTVLHVNGQTAALDFRETAPAAARRDMFLDDHGNPTEKSITGHLAVGVPGSVAGLWALHQKFGTKTWAELVEPAIQLADNGFEVNADFSSSIRDEAKRLEKFPASAALFLPDGKAPAEGARWRNPELAQTLRLIARNGKDGFYKNDTADRIVAEMRRGAGSITQRDLDAYEPKWREPVVFSYRGYRVASMPPPSSGGVTLALIAQQLEAYDLAHLGWHSPQSVHLQAEAMRRAFAVRNDVLGDPDFVAVDTAKLSSKPFARQLQASIAVDRATPSAQVSGRTGIQGDGTHTTHFSVADGFGNAVAMTTTLNSSFGSAVTVAGGGFVLNNEMDDFAAKPGAPNQFGLVQGEANAVAPGKRMLSAMTPTIVFDRNEKPILITGASGGPYIITTVFQLLSDTIDYGMSVSSAMSAPRLHHQHLPDELALEKDGFDRPTLLALEKLGHRLTFFDVPATGWTIAATIERRNERWHGMADPRIHGSGVGY